MIKKLLALSLVICVAMAPTQAESLRPTVVSGSARFSQSGGNWVIRASDRAVINWNQLNVPAGTSMRFIQPSSSASVLNRVTGGSASHINGLLTANGQLILINPAGINIGPSGMVRAQSFIASTLDIDNQQYLLGGDLHFKGDSSAGIVNMGTIEALGGDVYLLARTVNNQGALLAPDGTVAIVAAQDVLLTQDGELFINPDGIASEDTGLTNAGTIEALQAQLRANGNMYALAINNSGLIRANGASTEGGRVFLHAPGGSIDQTGTISANAGGAGGNIEIRGKTVVASAGSLTHVGTGGEIIFWGDSAMGFAGTAIAPEGLVETSGGYVAMASSDIQAGTWLLDPYNVTITNLEPGNNGENGNWSGGKWTPTSEDSLVSVDFVTQLLNSGTTVRITTTGDGEGLQAGDITVAAPITVNGPAPFSTLIFQADNDVFVNADILCNNAVANLIIQAANNVVFNASYTAANNGFVTIDAGGSVTSPGGMITASSMSIEAGTGIGTPAEALATSVFNVNAFTDTGGINIANQGRQILVFYGGENGAGLGVHTSGSINLTNDRTIRLEGGDSFVYAPGNITITATGEESDIVGSVAYSQWAEDAGISEGVGVIAAGGAVSLNADRDIILGGGDSQNGGPELPQNGEFETPQGGIYGVFGGTGVTMNAGRDIVLDTAVVVSGVDTHYLWNGNDDLGFLSNVPTSLNAGRDLTVMSTWSGAEAPVALFGWTDTFDLGELAGVMVSSGQTNLTAGRNMNLGNGDGAVVLLTGDGMTLTAGGAMNLDTPVLLAGYDPIGFAYEVYANFDTHFSDLDDVIKILYDIEPEKVFETTSDLWNPQAGIAITGGTVDASTSLGWPVSGVMVASDTIDITSTSGDTNLGMAGVPLVMISGSHQTVTSAGQLNLNSPAMLAGLDVPGAFHHFTNVYYTPAGPQQPVPREGWEQDLFPLPEGVIRDANIILTAQNDLAINANGQILGPIGGVMIASGQIGATSLTGDLFVGDGMGYILGVSGGQSVYAAPQGTVLVDSGMLITGVNAPAGVADLIRQMLVRQEMPANGDQDPYYEGPYYGDDYYYGGEYYCEMDFSQMFVPGSDLILSAGGNVDVLSSYVDVNEVMGLGGLLSASGKVQMLAGNNVLVGNGNGQIVVIGYNGIDTIAGNNILIDSSHLLAGLNAGPVLAHGMCSGMLEGFMGDMNMFLMDDLRYTIEDARYASESPNGYEGPAIGDPFGDMVQLLTTYMSYLPEGSINPQAGIFGRADGNIAFINSLDALMLIGAMGGDVDFLAQGTLFTGGPDLPLPDVLSYLGIGGSEFPPMASLPGLEDIEKFSQQYFFTFGDMGGGEIYLGAIGNVENNAVLINTGGTITVQTFTGQLLMNNMAITWSEGGVGSNPQAKPVQIIGSPVFNRDVHPYGGVLTVVGNTTVNATQLLWGGDVFLLAPFQTEPGPAPTPTNATGPGIIPVWWDLADRTDWLAVKLGQTDYTGSFEEEPAAGGEGQPLVSVLQAMNGYFNQLLNYNESLTFYHP